MTVLVKELYVPFLLSYYLNPPEDSQCYYRAAIFANYKIISLVNQMARSKKPPLPVDSKKASSSNSTKPKEFIAYYIQQHNL